MINMDSRCCYLFGRRRKGREGLESGSLQIVCGHAVVSHHSHTVVLQNQVVTEEVGLVTRSLTNMAQRVSVCRIMYTILQ